MENIENVENIIDDLLQQSIRKIYSENPDLTKKFTSEIYKYKYKVGYVIIFGKILAKLIKIKNGEIIQYEGKDYRKIKKNR